METIESKKLANGADLNIYDESKIIAGDRWLIKLRFETSLQWSSWMDEIIIGQGGDVDSVRQKLEGLSFDLHKERKFVDQGEKESVIEQIIAETHSNIVAYLSQENFLEKLLMKRLQDLKENSIITPEQPVMEELLDEDDGPADFSHCFK